MASDDLELAAAPGTAPQSALQKIDLVEYWSLAHGADFRPLGGVLEDLPLRHHFSDGLYGREIFMPAGRLVTTYIHRHESQFAIVRGEVTVYDGGGEPIHIVAPYIGITAARTRRALYTHTDTIWVTYHPNPDNCRDIETLEHRLAEPRFDLDTYAAMRMLTTG